MKKILLTLLTGVTLLTAGGDFFPATFKCGLYTDEYMLYSGAVHPCIDTEIPNSINGEMLLEKKVYFHASLYFKGGVLTESSQKALKTLKNTIETEGMSNYFVSVVGHSAGYEDSNHRVELNAWSTFWQNLGKTSVSRDIFAAKMNKRIKIVYDHLNEKEEIHATRIYTENRLARDPIATEATKEGRLLNERVDIALYY